ncbi:hypothetical protein ACLOJK_029557 [Asimina triloba]
MRRWSTKIWCSIASIAYTSDGSHGCRLIVFPDGSVDVVLTVSAATTASSLASTTHHQRAPIYMIGAAHQLGHDNAITDPSPQADDDGINMQRRLHPLHRWLMSSSSSPIDIHFRS